MQALCFNTIDHKICFTVLPLTNSLNFKRDFTDNYSSRTQNNSNLINPTNTRDIKQTNINMENNTNNKFLQPLSIQTRQLNNQNIRSVNTGINQPNNRNIIPANRQIQQLNNQNAQPLSTQVGFLNNINMIQPNTQIQQLNNQNMQALSTQTTLSEFFAGGFNKFITDTVINTANRFGYILTNPILSFFTTTFLSLLVAYITSNIIGPYTSGGANAVLRDWDSITIPFSNYLTQIIKNNISFIPNSIVTAIVTSTISYIYTLFSRLGFDIVQFLINPSIGAGFNAIGNSVSNLINPDLSNLDIGF